MSNLSHTQQARFAEMMLPVIRDDIYPVVLQAACRIARSQPNLTSTELADAVDQAVKEKLEEHDRFISEREAARLKEQRDPKHGAATVQPIGFPVTQPKGLPDPSRPRPARLQLVGRWHEQMAS
jgi:hypothetical protein